MTASTQTEKVSIELTAREVSLVSLAASRNAETAGCYRAYGYRSTTSGSVTVDPTEEALLIRELRRMQATLIAMNGDRGTKKVYTTLINKIDGANARCEARIEEIRVREVELARATVARGFTSPEFIVTIAPDTNNGRGILKVSATIATGYWSEFDTEISPEFTADGEVIYRVGRWSSAATFFTSKDEAIAYATAQANDYIASAKTRAQAEFDRTVQKASEAI